MDALTPTAGLMVYCTDCVPEWLYVANGSSFVNYRRRANLQELPLQRVRYYRLPVKYGWTKTWGLRKWRLLVQMRLLTEIYTNGDVIHDGHESRTSAVTAGPVAAGAEGANFITNSTAPYDWLSVHKMVTRWYGATSMAHTTLVLQAIECLLITEWKHERNTWATNNRQVLLLPPLNLPVAGLPHTQ